MIAGCGDVGTRVGRRLADAGHEVFGVRRRAERLPSSLRPISADLTATDVVDQLPDVDLILLTTAAAGQSDDAYRAAYVDVPARILASYGRRPSPPTRIVFCSSTGVYGEHDGEWVDEETPVPRRGDRQDALLEGEDLVLGAPFEGRVVRLSGIYGPGRTRSIDRVREGTARRHDPAIWTNRIHADDAAGALAHVLIADRIDRLLVATDDRPTTDGELLDHLATRLGVAAPPSAGPSSRGRGRRISNRRLRATGWSPRYPSFEAAGAWDDTIT